MIPLIVDIKELRYVKRIIDDTAQKIFEENSMSIDYKVGTMIETPRAALISDEIATEVEFFSFGTNDLTQLTYALSRDDAGVILNTYIEKNIFEGDPTAKIDVKGVGKLMKISIEGARKSQPDIKLGICGEHGGDPSSIEFCHSIGLNYVSCSPFRIPIAKLSAAQAAINYKA
jgi:pyruvate,orthophosphate dikinase